MNVCYVRISTDSQEHDSQLAAIKAAAGAEPELKYSDTGSAFKGARRPGLDSLMADAKAGKLQGSVLWIFSLSRLSRKGTRDVLNTLDALEKAGVKVRSVTEPVLDTGGPFRDVILSLLSTVAKLESSAKADRVKAWHALKRQRGERTGRKAKALDLDELRKLVAADASIGQIARFFKVSRNVVKRHLAFLTKGEAQESA